MFGMLTQISRTYVRGVEYRKNDGPYLWLLLFFCRRHPKKQELGIPDILI